MAPECTSGGGVGTICWPNGENGGQKTKVVENLEDESREEFVLTEVTWAPTILSQTSGPACRFTGEDNVKHNGSGNGTQDLRNDIRNKITHRHAACDQHSKTHGRIDVETGNRTDPISHRDDGQSECERNSKHVNGRRSGSHPGDDCRATSEENQRKRPDEFCRWLFHFFCLPRCEIDSFATLQQLGFLRIA